ncbi:FAD binding domain protein [Aspergillus nomiae NRRL 13137]|uniref:FAD binding domain protein n=1 Tax=Aspergillus nomiae NRRL (strain ATCC 15546 / NRRL 13137 / CBS 260.88 / M93) TaxID=1509407 RepID=A0A0L1JHK3_ASPN3|nr:FAD binding domain protein [Aspergillus nomiae NRRL 13137]KNG91250.1 FAD binding domain protein [Aspergillus nomiae NRRL 13137]
MGDKADVLIIGAGLAGLTAANCFNGSKNLRVRVIDKNPGTIERGKADGLKSISLEVLDTLGIGDAIRNESHRVEEIALWEPDSEGGLVRSMTVPDRVPELQKPREVTLDQGRIEHHMVAALHRHGNVEVSWKKRPIGLRVNIEAVEEPLAYPVTVAIRDVDDDIAPPEIIQARYLIACDGAHSWTRKHLNIPLVGDLTDSSWGAIDTVPKTDFPDTRKVCVIRSAQGTVMAIPREGKLVRLYVGMDGTGLDVAGGLDARAFTVDHVIDSARSLISPYMFEAGHVAWWSAYQVGQRVAEEFSRYDRVFLAGDAVHTHSPKAGQGMNTSIQEAYNIGWKLRFYLEQPCSPSLLSTYAHERRPIAQQLINFDREYLQIMATPNLDSDSFLSAFLLAMKFTTGIRIQYPRSLIVRPPPQVGETTAVATGLSPGMRLPDFQIVNQADGVPSTAHHRFVMTGKFRLLILAGSISKGHILRRLSAFGQWLATFQQNHSGTEAITIHSARRGDIELMDLPDVFHPWSDQYGWDYWRVYADDESYHDGCGEVYKRCGVDRDNGSVAVVRPDGYISLICDLEQADQIRHFFDNLGPLGSTVVARHARL